MWQRFNIGSDIEIFFSMSNKIIQYWSSIMTISNKISISGTISGVIYCFDFWCFWQDRILSCVLLSAKPPTMIWMMIAQWIWTTWLCWSRAFPYHYADQEPLPFPTLTGVLHRSKIVGERWRNVTLKENSFEWRRELPRGCVGWPGRCSSSSWMCSS